MEQEKEITIYYPNNELIDYFQYLDRAWDVMTVDEKRRIMEMSWNYAEYVKRYKESK